MESTRITTSRLPLGVHCAESRFPPSPRVDRRPPRFGTAVSATPVLTPRYRKAMDYAFRLHQTQTRKISGTPYIAHLQAVAALVLQQGGSEDEAIAAWLHDAVEDQGGLKTLAVIRRRFGDAVADIVMGCTDAVTQPKPPYHERKQAYIRHIATDAPRSVLLVSSADKLHNATELLQEYRRLGEGLWTHFSGGKEGTLWYYNSLIEAYQARNYHTPITEALERTVRELETAIRTRTA